MKKPVIGVIGGSGLYKLKDRPSQNGVTVNTPFGAPTSRLYREERNDVDLVFLARHGEGHTFLPSEVNYRANLFALKQSGARTIVSVSAVGSLRAEIEPGHLVFPDQYIDATKGHRPNTFFGSGVVGHAHFSDPTCLTLRNYLIDAARSLGLTTHSGGTYVCIEGPQFSTRAESHLYRSWSNPKHPVSVIGMTAMPEARLARELGLCYQTVALATDYDCWNEEKGDVTVEAILRVLGQNVANSRNLIEKIAERPFPACRSGCRDLMKHAVVTNKDSWPKDRLAMIEAVLAP